MTEGDKVGEITIKQVANSDKEELSNLMMLAFSWDPVVRFLFPDTSSYGKCFPDFFQAFIGTSVEDGTAWQASKGGVMIGAACWLGPGRAADEKSLEAILLPNCAPERLMEMLGLKERTDKLHPSASFWYLPMIGVDPYAVGMGVGSVLMADSLEKIDQEGAAAFLESSNPKNISLYTRCGFEPLQTMSLGGDPVYTPMLRKAR